MYEASVMTTNPYASITTAVIAAMVVMSLVLVGMAIKNQMAVRRERQLQNQDAYPELEPFGMPTQQNVTQKRNRARN